MKSFVLVPITLALLVGYNPQALAEHSNGSATATATATASGTIQLHSGLTLENRDQTIRPQDDLFRHVNGAWLAKFEIPADKSHYGTFTRLGDISSERLKALIEGLSAEKTKIPTQKHRKSVTFIPALWMRKPCKLWALNP